MKGMASALVALASTAVATAGLAPNVFFTYDDPNGPPRELMYTAGDANSEGTITFSSAVELDLVADASAAGFGIVTYQVSLDMDLSVGQASQVVPGTWQAPISGSFTFRDGATDLLTGDIMDGAFLTFGTTGNVNANSATFSLMMTAANDLLAQLGGNQIDADFNTSWTLSDFMPGAPSINQFGYLTSFMANTAFVGSGFVVPAPGSAALLAVAGLVALPRRRS